jgi:hypothetical protein
MTNPVLPTGTFTKAVALANEAHLGQVDKGGFPYILHVLRVGLAGRTDVETVVGFLHDAIEDGEVTDQTLRARRFPDEVVAAVVALTHRTGDTYEEYLEQVKANPIARSVKLNDLADNLREDRVAVIPDSLVRRYTKARAFLEDTDEGLERPADRLADAAVGDAAAGVCELRPALPDVDRANGGRPVAVVLDECRHGAVALGELLPGRMPGGEVRPPLHAVRNCDERGRGPDGPLVPLRGGTLMAAEKPPTGPPPIEVPADLAERVNLVRPFVELTLIHTGQYTGPTRGRVMEEAHAGFLVLTEKDGLFFIPFSNLAYWRFLPET